MKSLLRDGTIVETYDGEGKWIEFLYGSRLGKGFTSILVRPWVSQLAGLFLDSRLSRFLIKPFIQKNHLDLRDYPERPYESFNDFFTRKICEGRRPLDEDERHFLSPCDGKATLFPLEKDAAFTIKGCSYTLDRLLRSRKLAELYKGGWGILLRLSVDDYHRYIYPVSGEKIRNYRISGFYHTVNPRAAMARSIYQENTREFTILKSDLFGPVLMMEVGAMLVGRITNLHEAGPVIRGEEKGYFEFGGSSILLLTRPGFYIPDPDLAAHSKAGYETVIRQGECIGSAPPLQQN